MRFGSILVILSVLPICSCAGPSYQSRVDAIKSPSARLSSPYIILSGNKNVKESDLKFQQIAGYTENILSQQGMRRTDNFDEAVAAVFLSYGIGSPRSEPYSYSMPIYGQTGVSSSSTYGSMSTFGNRTSFTGTTNYVPTYGVTGYSTHIGSNTIYDRYISLVCFDLEEWKQAQKQNEMWQTEVFSSGSNGDIREVVPYMLIAAAPYISTNLPKQVTISVGANDERVQQITGQLP